MIKIIFLFTFFFELIFPQSDLIKQKEFADSLFESENYFDAIKEYKRLIFFDKENIFSFYSLTQIGNCYKYGRKFDEASNYYSIALTKAKTNEEIFASKINICRISIIQKRTKNAHRILDELQNDSAFVHFNNQIKFWRAWTFFFEMDWEKAQHLFDEVNKNELSELCKQNQKEFYSVQKEKILSMIIPGLGQIYTENYSNGLGSFLWNLLAGYLTIKSFSEDRIFDGIVISNLLWLRFYQGNIENAEKFANEKNQILFEKTLIHIFKDFHQEIP